MRILVVEDEVGIASSLRRGLTADGFDVDVAPTGTAGLRSARTTAYDVIVLDVMLPGIDGTAVCRTLRSEGHDTPILMLTAKDADREVAAGLDIGADDYLVKPFSYVVLLSRIRALIRRTRREPPATELAVGDLRLDRRAHVAHRGDVPVDLSPRALAVLAVLMEHAGRVVSKEAILDAVWDHASAGNDNIVEVYVSRIRSAIDTPFGRHAVQTVRGLGYRLEANGG